MTLNLKQAAILVLFSGVSLTWNACSSNEEATQADSDRAGAAKAAQEVRFAPVESAVIPREIRTTGTLMADEIVTVSSEVSGTVLRVHREIGEFVNRGDRLVELDPREFQIDLDRNRAMLQESLARLGAEDPEHLPEPESVSSVREARAVLEDAELKLSMARELLERGAISRAQRDDAQTQYQVAETRHQNALQMARNQIAAVRTQQTAVAMASKKLGDTLLRAPVPGYIDARHVSAGEYISDQTAVYRIVQSQRLKLIAEVPEIEASRVHTGLRVALSVEAYPEREFSARIIRISPSVKQESRTFEIEARVDAPAGDGYRLKPGFFARVRIEAGQTEALFVPREALYQLVGVKKVFVRRGDRVEERLVETGMIRNGAIEIRTGVSAGEEVAVTAVESLSDGQQVQAVRMEGST